MQELSPIEWALRPLKKYAVFSGRAPRAEYWWFYLATVVVGLGVDVIDRIAGDSGIIGGVYNLGLLVPSVAVTIRRLHDTDRSGGWLLAFIIPLATVVIFGVGASFKTEGWMGLPVLIAAVIVFIIAAIAMLVFMVSSGTEGPNRYGPDPYGPDQLEEVFA